MNLSQKKEKRGLILIFHNKRANMVGDVLLVIFVLFIFGLVSMLAFKAWQDIEPDLSTEVSGSAEATTVVTDINTNYPSLFDGLIIFVFILLWAVVIVASFLIDSHPIFFIFMAVIMIFVLIAAMYLSNGVEELFTDVELSGLITSFPKGYWLLTHSLETMIAVIISVAVTLYGKSKI